MFGRGSGARRASYLQMFGGLRYLMGGSGRRHNGRAVLFQAELVGAW